MDLSTEQFMAPQVTQIWLSLRCMGFHPGKYDAKSPKKIIVYLNHANFYWLQTRSQLTFIDYLKLILF